MIIKLTGNQSKLYFHFEHHFLNDGYKIGLIGFYSTYLIPNFTEKNNKIGNIIIPPGQYTFDNLKKVVKNLKLNEVTNTFNLSNEVLDRPRKLYPIETINIHCNLADGMIVEGHKESDIISTFKINSQFKQPIIHEPKNILYFPVQRSSLNKIEIKICDQDNDLIDFGGADITVILEIK